MKFFRKLIAVIVLIAMLPTAAFAGLDDNSTADENWDISKSKEATELDNDVSNVTLSLPSAEEKLTSDVVFVIDKSSCANETMNKAKGILDQLVATTERADATVKVAVVVFKGNGKVMKDLTELTSDNLDEFKTAMTTPGDSSQPGGTNMQDGLLKAQEILDNDEEVTDRRKSLVLVSDGLTRLFTGQDGKVKDIYY